MICRKLYCKDFALNLVYFLDSRKYILSIDIIVISDKIINKQIITDRTIKNNLLNANQSAINVC